MHRITYHKKQMNNRVLKRGYAKDNMYYAFTKKNNIQTHPSTCSSCMIILTFKVTYALNP